MVVTLYQPPVGNASVPLSKAINKMFAYNHKKSEWKEVAAMKTPRSMFGAVIHKGKIIVAGGVNEEGLTGACEAYDFATNKYVPSFSSVKGFFDCTCSFVDDHL